MGLGEIWHHKLLMSFVRASIYGSTHFVSDALNIVKFLKRRTYRSFLPISDQRSAADYHIYTKPSSKRSKIANGHCAYMSVRRIMHAAVGFFLIIIQSPNKKGGRFFCAGVTTRSENSAASRLLLPMKRKKKKKGRSFSDR